MSEAPPMHFALVCSGAYRVHRQGVELIVWKHELDRAGNRTHERLGTLAGAVLPDHIRVLLRRELSELERLSQ